MPPAKKTRFFYLIFLLLIYIQATAQSSVSDKKVTLSFSNIPLGTALRKISNQADVKFSYNPELVPVSKRISFKCSNMPLGEALKQIINDPAITFRPIGNQMVLYRGDAAETTAETVKLPVAEKPVTKKPADTVYRTLTDTVVIHRTDTVFQTINTIRIDTVRVTDTVYKYRTQKAGKRPRNPFGNNSVSQQKFLENNGFYAGVYTEALPGAPVYSDAGSENTSYQVLMKNATKARTGDFSAGVLFGYDYFRLGLRSGIGITRLGERFEYAFLQQTGGFYRTDTLTRYYTLHGSDTAWFYITDSTWIPKETTNVNYKNPNTYHYIDIPVSVKFRIWQNESADIYALAGITGSFLAGHNALVITPAGDQNAAWLTKQQLASALFSASVGAGATIKLGGRAGVMGEITYHRQLNDQFRDMPLKKTFNLASLRLGFFVRL